MPKDKRIGRRSLLKSSATGLAAATALQTIAHSGCAGKTEQVAVGPKTGRRPDYADRLTLGLIGCGDLGVRHHLRRYLAPEKEKFGFDVVAVCDVDRNHRDEAAQVVLDHTGRRVRSYHDYRDLLDRQDIDAVVIVVPDHWHALVSIAAMEAGKDVYCEKPLTLTIEEGRAMVSAARRYGAVFQTGSMQRSDLRFRKACELVRNNKIGTIHKVETYIGGIDAGEWQLPQTPPAELDWDFWLGPAPYADFSPNRCHYQFRWYQDYSGGKMTDWGAHHNDIAQWGLGTDDTGPAEVQGEGVFDPTGPHDVARRFEVRYKYASGVELICSSEGKGGYDNGVKFYGSDGWIFVNRGKIEASDLNVLRMELGSDDLRLYNTGESKDNWINHYRNWIDCIKTRQRCICDVEVGHRSATVCHLGNIAMRLGRPLKWDPVKEQCVDDAVANMLVGRPMRAPWHL